MKKMMMAMAGVAAFGLAACSQPSVEDQFFDELDNAVAEIEQLAEQERVCMSEVAAISERQDEDLMPLAEQLEEKHGSELPEEYEERMMQLSERMQAMMMELMPKMDLNC